MIATNFPSSFSLPVPPIASRNRSATSTGSRVQPSRSRGRRSQQRGAVGRACLEVLEDRRLMSFAPAVSYPAGADPREIIAADFNNDGRLDLAVANYAGNNVSVLLGNAGGTFQPALNSATGAGPKSVAVGDFNADGRPDLATANDADVSVLLGKGDGAFQAPTRLALGAGDGLFTGPEQPASVAVGDFNADGRLDLGITANTYYNWYGYYGTADVLLGHGDGSFAEPISNFLDWGWHTSAAVADFNGDGVRDYAAGNSDYWTVSVLLGDGSGYLAYSGSWLPTGGSPSSVAAGDVNGDLKTDLVTANSYGDPVSVLLGNGAGGFSAAQDYTVGGPFTSVSLGDFDRDGKVDIAAANPAGNNVSVLRGRNDGTFSPPESFAAGAGAGSVAAADFNGDGWLDLATADSSGNTASVLINDQNWPPPPASLSIDDVIVTEGNSGTTTAVFTVTRGGSLAGTATVNYSTANGGALAGSDYAATSGTLTFAGGVATMQIAVPVNGDLTDEYDQGFSVNLSAPSGAVITDGQGLGTILDDDDAPTVMITSKVSAAEGKKNSSTSFNFAVKLSAPSEKDVWVSFATANGTATTQSGDYLAKSGTLYFAPGVTSQTISVLVRGDTDKEADETFFVNLTGVTNATLLAGQSQGIGEILNDDKTMGSGGGRSK